MWQLRSCSEPDLEEGYTFALGRKASPDFPTPFLWRRIIKTKLQLCYIWTFQFLPGDNFLAQTLWVLNLVVVAMQSVLVWG